MKQRSSRTRRAGQPAIEGSHGSAPTSGGTQAVDRAAALISLVVRADEPLSFTELSDETGLARSTTSRLLAALERTELVERDPSGGDGARPPFALPPPPPHPGPPIPPPGRPPVGGVG